MEENGIGWSDCTSEKNHQFRGIIRTNILMWKSIIDKRDYFNGNYTYIDLNAGPGIHPEYGPGSPVIFLEEIQKVQPLRYCAHLFENNLQTICDLSHNLGIYYDNKSVYIHPVDNIELLRVVGERNHGNNVPGLLYSDPTGQAPPSELLSEFSKLWRSVDILIYSACTNIKRQLQFGGRKRFIECLEIIDRKSCMIREPIGAYQWTFAYLTNGPLPEWKKKGFFDVKSPEGKAILSKLNYTKEELSYGVQPALL